MILISQNKTYFAKEPVTTQCLLEWVFKKNVTNNFEKELKQLESWPQVEEYFVSKLITSLRNSMPRDPLQIELAKKEIRIISNSQVSDV